MRVKLGRAAFSLVELVIAAGIVAILLGLLMPAIVHAKRVAMAVQCRAQLSQLGQAISIYASDNSGSLPSDFYAAVAFPRPWTEILYGHIAPKTIVCPTGRDIEERQSYMLNVWLLAYQIRMNDRVRGLSHSDVVLAGENRPGVGYDHNIPGVIYPKLSYDPYRHGRSLKSNYLWFDLHVSNEAPGIRPGLPDPWYVQPAR